MIRPILVDTDVIIDHLRGFENSKKLLKEVELGNFLAYFSTITEAELYSGQRMSVKSEQRIVERLLKIMHRVDVNSEIARKAGELRREYGVELPNAIIAATALILGAELVTRNIKHYKTIKKIKLKTPDAITKNFYAK
ncbi:MAG: type II toxin-antitoxin system VapC family toxin [Candidatus Freyarchaeota archaeon]|nr:type II toxin-antitoxin system VapC family toxin [Candidatus Jordarchaeia archaeon]MBS7269117.1 type II toxin-antitoxin system VapC family toxin [Candidatus Jordarchaeia archaeon]MBS7279182.1 type II toxin-antitoxin system VapC family toxin [Candidatus Jordarchaeia archaeon]